MRHLLCFSGQCLPLTDTKPMLFIGHNKCKIPELDTLLDQSMCSDNDLRFSTLNQPAGFAFFPCLQTSVGAMMAPCIPAAAVWTRARNAMMVFPQPTSPWTSLAITLF